ncbi:T9SS type A sorting domain-containing protein [bacterium]|nr:T9SS type A sorting domain-containing protein [bacterium]
MKQTKIIFLILNLMLMVGFGFAQLVGSYTAYRATYGIPNAPGQPEEWLDRGTSATVESILDDRYLVVADYEINFDQNNLSPNGNLHEHALKFIELDNVGDITQQSIYYINNKSADNSFGNEYSRVVRVTRVDPSDPQESSYYYVLYNYTDYASNNGYRYGVLCLDVNLNIIWDKRISINDLDQVSLGLFDYFLRGVQIIPCDRTGGISILSELKVLTGSKTGTYLMVMEMSTTGTIQNTGVIDPQTYDIVGFTDWTPDITEVLTESGEGSVMQYAISFSGSNNGKAMPGMLLYDITSGTISGEIAIEIPNEDYVFASAILVIKTNIATENDGLYSINNVYLAGQANPTSAMGTRGIIIELPFDVFYNPSAYIPKYSLYQSFTNVYNGFHDISTSIKLDNQSGVVGYGFTDYIDPNDPNSAYRRAFVGTTQDDWLSGVNNSLLDKFGDLEYGPTTEKFYGFHMASSLEYESQMLVGKSGPEEIQVEKTGIDINSVLDDYSFQKTCAEKSEGDGIVTTNGNCSEKDFAELDVTILQELPNLPMFDLDFERTWYCYIEYPEQDYSVIGTNCGMWEELPYSSTGIDEHENINRTLIYPNPTNGNIAITSSVAIREVSIYNVDGQLVQSQKVTNSLATSIDIKSFDSGIYTVKIATEEGVEMHRLVKY